MEAVEAVEGHGSHLRRLYVCVLLAERPVSGARCIHVAMSPGRASAWLARGPGRMNDAGVRVRRAREVCEVCEVCERDPARRTWIVVRSRASRVGAWRGLS